MSFGSTGLRDWLIQRWTALFLTGYTLFLTFFLLIKEHGVLTFEAWQLLFSHPLMQISTLCALICVALHAWIGLWTVLTDYVKSILLRYLLLGIILFILFADVVWGVMILWGG